MHLGPYAPTLIQPWSRINETSSLNICKMIRKTELKIYHLIFSSFNITSYFICNDLISSLFDPRLVDPGSTLIYIGAYSP